VLEDDVLRREIGAAGELLSGEASSLVVARQLSFWRWSSAFRWLWFAWAAFGLGHRGEEG
jgi:hypothetical protein